MLYTIGKGIKRKELFKIVKLQYGAYKKNHQLMATQNQSVGFKIYPFQFCREEKVAILALAFQMRAAKI